MWRRLEGHRGRGVLPRWGKTTRPSPENSSPVGSRPATGTALTAPGYAGPGSSFFSLARSVFRSIPRISAARVRLPPTEASTFRM